MNLIPSDFAEVLRAEGLRVVELPGWQSYKTSGAFTPIGVVNHHTVTKASADDLALANAIRAGNHYNILIGRDGSVFMIGAGRMWHAGIGMQEVLSLSKAGYAPTGNATAPGKVNGNEHYFGVAVANWGVVDKETGLPVEPLPHAQLQALFVVNAFLQIALGNKTSAATSIHHREWTSRKIDISWYGDLRGSIEYIMMAPQPEPVTAGFRVELTKGSFAMFNGNDSKAFYLVQPDGAVFAMAGAKFRGSLPSIAPGLKLDEPIVAGTVTLSGMGYYLVAADGGIFNFGDAPPVGSLVGKLDSKRGVPVAAEISSAGDLIVYGNVLQSPASTGIYKLSPQR